MKFKFKTNSNWRSKPHPYWFVRRWSGDAGTVQIMRFEIHWRVSR